MSDKLQKLKEDVKALRRVRDHLMEAKALFRATVNYDINMTDAEGIIEGRIRGLHQEMGALMELEP